MTYLLVLIFLEYYQKFDLADELRQLSKIGRGEAKDRKRMNLLYELTQSTNIDCPETVVRLYLINIY